MKEFYKPPEVITPDMEAELIFVESEKTPFWKKLLIYCAVWLVIICIACGFMWSVMSQYEASLPTTAMDEYIVSSRQDMFFFATSSLLDEIDNKFENSYDCASKLSKNYSGTLTYTKLTTEYTYENPTYIISHNGENLFKVTLEHDEETGFMKFKKYAVKSVELLKPDLITFDSYKIVFASNMLVHINNTSFGTSLDEYERVDIFGRSDYYGIVVDNFVHEPEVVALSYIYEEAPEKVITAKRVGNYYIFERDGEETSTLTITAPTDAIVSIDEKQVSKLFATKQYTAGSTEMTVYTVPTVFEAKKITVTLDGKPLELIQNGLSFTAAVDQVSYTVTIPHGAELFIDNKKADASLITDESAMWHSDFEEIKNYPTATEYTLSNETPHSSLSATLDGEQLVAYKDGNSIAFTSGNSTKLYEEYSDNATEFVHQYLYYNTQGYRNTETNLANTLRLVAPSSPLRSYLNLANIGIQFNSPKKMDIEYLTADNFIPYGDDAFICDVSYKVTLDDSINVVVEENVIRLIFVKSGGRFLPAKFIL